MRREYEPKSSNRAIRVITDDKTIPFLGKGEKFPMTVAPFQDHGRPCFVGSAIRSNPTFFELARQLTPEESKKANERLAIEIEQILDGNEARRVATLSAKGKPDIHVLNVGESYDPRGLRLYYTRSKYNNTPAIYQLAISRLKDSSRVERVFEEAGYRGTKNWEKRKIH